MEGVQRLSRERRGHPFRTNVKWVYGFLFATLLWGMRCPLVIGVLAVGRLEGTLLLEYR